MLEKLRRQPWVPWVGTGGRLVLGVVLLVAGSIKVTDLADSVHSTLNFKILPIPMARFVGSMLPFVEILVGLLLIAGLATRLAAAVGAILQVAFLIGIISAWSRGLRIDCGCFGGGGALADNAAPAYPWDTLRDLGLLSLAAFLVLFPETKYSADAKILDGGKKR